MLLPLTKSKLPSASTLCSDIKVVIYCITAVFQENDIIECRELNNYPNQEISTVLKSTRRAWQAEHKITKYGIKEKKYFYYTILFVNVFKAKQQNMYLYKKYNCYVSVQEHCRARILSVLLSKSIDKQLR